ncbi:MAG: RDD family protein [Pseudomonadota bacterium]|nr:RDD family protein [Pseudomonadota bacterium]
MVYESVLLFGVLFATALLFGMLFQQRHALTLRHPLQAVAFCVMGAYFVWFWSHGGQTLAMKTWRVRIVAADGRPLTVARAGFRYLLAWLWVLPGLLLAALINANGTWLAIIPAANVLVWAALATLQPTRQFLHDRLAGTAVVAMPAASST